MIQSPDARKAINALKQLILGILQKSSCYNIREILTKRSPRGCNFLKIGIEKWNFGSIKLDFQKFTKNVIRSEGFLFKFSKYFKMSDLNCNK